MGTRKNLLNRVESRKSGAAKRAADRMVRSAQDQINVLDKRLGIGIGAFKERARLQG